MAILWIGSDGQVARIGIGRAITDTILSKEAHVSNEPCSMDFGSSYELPECAGQHLAAVADQIHLHIDASHGFNQLPGL